MRRAPEVASRGAAGGVPGGEPAADIARVEAAGSERPRDVTAHVEPVGAVDRDRPVGCSSPIHCLDAIGVAPDGAVHQVHRPGDVVARPRVEHLDRVALRQLGGELLDGQRGQASVGGVFRGSGDLALRGGHAGATAAQSMLRMKASMYAVTFGPKSRWYACSYMSSTRTGAASTAACEWSAATWFQSCFVRRNRSGHPARPHGRGTAPLGRIPAARPGHSRSASRGRRRRDPGSCSPPRPGCRSTARAAPRSPSRPTPRA